MEKRLRKRTLKPSTCPVWKKAREPPKKSKGSSLPLKTLTSLNKEVRLCFLSDSSIWSFPLFLPLAITSFGGHEGYFSLAIIAFGAFRFILPKYYYRLGKMDNKEFTVFKVTEPLKSLEKNGKTRPKFLQAKSQLIKEPLEPEPLLRNPLDLKIKVDVSKSVDVAPLRGPNIETKTLAWTLELFMFFRVRYFSIA